ncbi:MAG TPA: peptide-methionine (S)-S-oxide reductase MsrA [Thermomicrobiaceae bacterium]|nr:peptide-methionine (S)-S-oxide reductase MsrA [Thermomicrobiaceae bacterium]
MFGHSKTKLVDRDQALPGRDHSPFTIPEKHAVLGTPIQPPFPAGYEQAVFALGCFWGAERLFWQTEGVYTTASGYTGGYTPYPTYEEVCGNKTGHAEAVLVVFDPEKISYEQLLRIFFEAHDPTQGMRQGGDIGTQYRSAIFYANDEQRRIAEATKKAYNAELKRSGYDEITTEIEPLGPFYYAEDYHQQYLHKVPNGYCGLAGTGVTCPIPALSQNGNGSQTHSEGDGMKPVAGSEDEWKQRLSRDEYAVLRQAATERPFSGKYVEVFDDGTYHCAACGNPLFDSDTKFYSSCGWPSFSKTITPDAVEYVEDRSHGMVRTEVRCGRCHSHLGHVFDDGPVEAGGQRYCMNSVALDLHENEKVAR